MLFPGLLFFPVIDLTSQQWEQGPLWSLMDVGVPRWLHRSCIHLRWWPLTHWDPANPTRLDQVMRTWTVNDRKWPKKEKSCVFFLFPKDKWKITRGWPALGLYNLPWERNWGGPTTPDRAYSAPRLVSVTTASDPPRLEREVCEVFSLGLAFAVLFSPQSFTSTVSETSFSTELRQPSLTQISQISPINLIPQCYPSSHPLPRFLSLPFCLLGSAVVGCVSLYTLAMQMPILWMYESKLLPSFALRFGPWFLIAWLCPQRPAQHAGVPG